MKLTFLRGYALVMAALFSAAGVWIGILTFYHEQQMQDVAVMKAMLAPREKAAVDAALEKFIAPEDDDDDAELKKDIAELLPVIAGPHLTTADPTLLMKAEHRLIEVLEEGRHVPIDEPLRLLRKYNPVDPRPEEPGVGLVAGLLIWVVVFGLLAIPIWARGGGK